MSRIRSISELQDEAIHPRVIEALRKASADLSARGVRHAVLGAIAVGVHGWPRATKDVDLLVAPEGWDVAPDGSQTPRVPMPEQIDGVPIDYLSIDVAGDFLLSAFDGALVSERIPIAPVEVVVVTKLLRMLARDEADVVELMKSGTVAEAIVRAYLDRHTPMLTARFERLCEQARRELGL